jgi:hypothetical protein
MNQLTFSIFQKTDKLAFLRLLDHEGKPLGERELDNDAINGLAALVDAYYRRNTPRLAGIGRQLYDWLDGPTERWLARAEEGVGGGADRQSRRERRLNLEAARALAQVRAWLDLVTVLGNLGASEEADAPDFLAQALWLTLRVGVPLERSVDLAARLLTKLGPAAEAAPLIAAGAMLFARTRGERHPEREKYQRGAFNLLAKCAEARGLTNEAEFGAWFTGAGLDDAGRFVPQLDAALVGLVGAREWLFDRDTV